MQKMHLAKFTTLSCIKKKCKNRKKISQPDKSSFYEKPLDKPSGERLNIFSPKTVNQV